MRKRGLHLLCFWVQDLSSQMALLYSTGSVPLEDNATAAATTTVAPNDTPARIRFLGEPNSLRGSLLILPLRGVTFASFTRLCWVAFPEDCRLKIRLKNALNPRLSMELSVGRFSKYGHQYIHKSRAQYDS